MKITYTKDYQPSLETVSAELVLNGFPTPTKLEVTGSVIEIEFAEMLDAATEIKLRDLLTSFGYFQNK